MASMSVMTVIIIIIRNNSDTPSESRSSIEALNSMNLQMATFNTRMQLLTQALSLGGTCRGKAISRPGRTTYKRKTATPELGKCHAPELASEQCWRGRRPLRSPLPSL